MNNHFSEKYWSYVVIIYAVVYFISETWYYITYNQFTIQLVADYSVIFLLLLAGSVHLKTFKGIGLFNK